MNGHLKQRAVAIISGKYQAPVDEKLDLLLGIALDTCTAVESHEDRIGLLEAYPATIRRITKLLIGLGATAGAVAAIVALVG